MNYYEVTLKITTDKYGNKDNYTYFECIVKGKKNYQLKSEKLLNTITDKEYIVLDFWSFKSTEKTEKILSYDSYLL